MTGLLRRVVQVLRGWKGTSTIAIRLGMGRGSRTSCFPRLLPAGVPPQPWSQRRGREPPNPFGRCRKLRHRKAEACPRSHREAFRQLGPQPELPSPQPRDPSASDVAEVRRGPSWHRGGLRRVDTDGCRPAGWPQWWPSCSPGSRRGWGWWCCSRPGACPGPGSPRGPRCPGAGRPAPAASSACKQAQHRPA